jgi:hypothetical protein
MPTWTTQKYDWKPIQLKYEDDYFFLQLSKNKSGIYMVWLHFAGSASKAEEYWCTIEAFSKDDPERSVVFSGDVIPITVGRDTVQKTIRNVLAFSNTIAQTLLTKGDNMACHKLFFNVSIGKR